MNKKIILVLFFVLLTTQFTFATLYINGGELNRRLLSCTPTKDFKAGSSTTYQISGLTGSTCVFKIEHNKTTHDPNLICRVPLAKMNEMTSSNPVKVEKIKNKYCKISMKIIKK